MKHLCRLRCNVLLSRKCSKFNLLCSLLGQCPKGGDVFRISSNRDDHRIVLGLKFSILGFFWIDFLGVLLDSKDFWGGIKNIQKISGNALIGRVVL